jgi:transposase-like protein
MSPLFPPEFRREAIRLIRRSDKPLPVLAKDLGVWEPSLRTWRRQPEVDRRERDGLSSEELVVSITTAAATSSARPARSQDRGIARYPVGGEPPSYSPPALRSHV